MKTRSLIWLFSIVSVLTFVGLSLVFKSVIGSKNQLLRKEGYSTLRQETGKIYSLKTTALEQYIFDNSFWTELLTAIRNRDTGWIESNLLPSARKFEVDACWLLNEQGAEVYFYDASKNSSTPLIAIAGPTLLRELKVKPFNTFFIRHEGKLAQIVTAPVQPSDDEKRITPHRGYLILGRYTDTAFIEKINHLAEHTRFTLCTAAGTDTIESGSNQLRYYLPLKDFSGKPAAWLRAEKKLAFISAYTSYVSAYLWIYLGLVALIMLAYYQFLRTRVLNPVSKLSLALQTKNTDGLKSIRRRKDEFAGFAHLIEDSFSQTHLLQQEVEARKASEAALKKSATELEQATIEKIRAEQDRLAKAEFLSTMSHEIRTPINGVIGIANLLKDEQLTPQQQELVNTLLFSSSHLLSILTDILDFSKIEAGNVKFDRVNFNLREICNSVHNLFISKAKEKNIDFFILSDDRVQGYLTGDSVRLCQVLNNLVSNAIKFTDEGQVTLKYRMVGDDGFKQIIEFTIQDTGIGIPADKVDTIFDSFSQASRSINTNYGGTGLGLTISKKIIELQGGKISVGSKPGKGTNFTIFLTFDKLAATGEQPVLLTRKKKPGNLSGLRVLVAEDNKINAMVLGKFLEKWDVTMELAGNGQEALNKLKQEPFDLVLMDLHMPVMDGMEATRQIRSNSFAAYSAIPVIALTADATSETQKIIIEKGFDHYLSKPFNPDSLFKVMEKYYQPVT